MNTNPTSSLESDAVEAGLRKRRSPIARVMVIFAVLVGVIATAISPAAAASDLNAHINGAGDLIVTGAGSGDEVRIESDNNRIIVTDSWTGDTVLNRPASALRRDVVVNLRGGSDRVRLYDVDIPRDLRVDLATGGEDNFGMNDTVVGRNLRVTGTGTETWIGIYPGSRVVGATTITTGAGYGNLSVEGASLHGNFKFTSNVAGRLLMYTNNAHFHGNLQVRGGNHTDEVIFAYGTRIDGVAKVELLGGDDLVDLRDDVDFSKWTLFRLGVGEDTLEIDGITLRRGFRFELGGGEDYGMVQNVDVRQGGTVDGGPRNDLVGFENLSHPNRVRIVNIEGMYVI